MKRVIALLLAALLAGGAAVAKDAAPLAQDPAVEQRMLSITEEMRCLVCQNESIAASQADLAGDLRKEIREQIRQGKTDAQIRDYMVARYGDFVLYRPRVSPKTYLLWAGPFVLMVAGVVILLVYMRRRNRALAAEEQLTEEEARRAQALLEEAK
jgi:cytochrome c-type biogenesis protein CcmH